MPETAWSYIPVKLASITKGELDATKHLICQVQFIAFGTWYTLLNYSGTSAQIQNGAIPSPFRIEVPGAMTTFTWNIGGLTGKWSGSVTSGQKLVIDSNPESMEIAIYNGNTFVSNEYGNCDFTTERLFFVAPGTQSMTLTKSASVEVRKYAYSV